MAKKKSNKQKSGKQSVSFTEALEINKIFQNERLIFYLGVILFAMAIYMTLAFVSFFTTGAADQSIIENLRLGELQNAHHEFKNLCGSMGSYLSWYCIKRCFGIPAFLIPLLMLVTSLHMMKAYRAHLLKWFFALMIIMIWASVTLAKFLSPLFAESHFNPGGDHGRYICQQIEGYVGTPGLTVVLALIAIAFLTYISAETILVIRKLLNPMKFLDRVKFKITNNDPDEPVMSYEDQIQTDDLVYDDPQTQTVEFPEGKEPIGNDGFGDLYGKGKTGKATTKPDNQKGPGFEVETAKDEEAAEGKNLVQVGEKELEPYDPKRDLENYHYPTLDLLKK